jgi:hypothetical protein
MGGVLELRAVFPHGEAVRINQFEALNEPDELAAQMIVGDQIKTSAGPKTR